MTIDIDVLDKRSANPYVYAPVVPRRQRASLEHV